MQDRHKYVRRCPHMPVSRTEANKTQPSGVITSLAAMASASGSRPEGYAFSTTRVPDSSPRRTRLQRVRDISADRCKTMGLRPFRTQPCVDPLRPPKIVNFAKKTVASPSGVQDELATFTVSVQVLLSVIFTTHGANPGSGIIRMFGSSISRRRGTMVVRTPRIQARRDAALRQVLSSPPLRSASVQPRGAVLRASGRREAAHSGGLK